MHHFIDRRKNPKGKSLGNRQRFLKRARAHIKAKVDGAIKNRAVTDILNGETISIPTKDISEPKLHSDPGTGARDRIFPGNKEFNVGDKIKRPPKGGGGKGGREGSDDGDSEDEFQFTLSRDEFLDFLFEDMELPNLIKRDLMDLTHVTMERAGISVTGSPSNFNVLRTMRNAHARRLALHRPPRKEETDLEQLIEEMEDTPSLSALDQQNLAVMKEELERIRRKRKRVPFVDPVDVRYNAYQAVPKPISKAVMFCLMDVSASMQEREKGLAKRFFLMLHLFLNRRYDKIDLVFIRHTHVADEVDEETFFYDRTSGGTVVSSALKKMHEVIQERYDPALWNIYAAHASDGENYSTDQQVCDTVMREDVLPLVQYFAYVEIIPEQEMSIYGDLSSGELWRLFGNLQKEHDNLAVARISNPADIYPVFKQLFTPSSTAAE